MRNSVVPGLVILLFFCPGLVAAESKTQKLNLEVDSEVFARQGNAVVTQAQFDAYFRSRVPEKDRREFLSSADRIGQMLENLMVTQLLATDGMDQGLLDDPEVQAAAYHAVMRVLADKQRERHWEENRLDDYTSQAREQYLINKERYTTEEAVDFTHLLVGTRERSSEEALDLARQLRDRIDEGENLVELAETYSDDPTFDRNRGSFQEAKRDELDEEFAEMVFSMEPGDIAGPVPSEFGWHIVRLDELHKSRQKGFEEVEDQLVRRARENHRNRSRDRYLSRLVSEPLEIPDGAVQKFLDRYDASLPSGERITGD